MDHQAHDCRQDPNFRNGHDMDHEEERIRMLHRPKKTQEDSNTTTYNLFENLILDNNRK